MSDDAAKTDQIRAIVGRVFPAGEADWLVDYCKLDGFLNAAGEVDEDKIMDHLNVIHAVTQQHPQSQPGDNARAALRARHGVGADDDSTPNGSSGIQRGSAGRAALAARHGRQK